MLPWRPYLSGMHRPVRNQIRIFQAVSPDRNSVAYGHAGTASRQVGTIEMIAATRGPASLLPA
jgi:hypothetical protein